ncbi:MAG TPA: peptide chain release factor N(5)-glutamine methyltransferase [Williamwhitmania sp.]|nr:peptide chain release factor N(5)-glutamine methyltransferase [Williamwhitmania sp.]
MPENKTDSYHNAFRFLEESITPIYGKQEASSIAKLFLEDTLNISSYEIFLYPDHQVDQLGQSRIIAGAEKLIHGMPVQYVIGKTEFVGLPFVVTPDVLIPRPETEELLWWIVSDLQSEEVCILDIGTGSGCLAVTMSKMLSKATVFATDISLNALSVAEQNANQNQATVHFLHDNMLDPGIELRKLNCEVIVSNPPYITEKEKKQMHSNVLEYEPHLALFVPNEDPLKFYKAICDYALVSTLPKTTVYLEINESFGTETAEIFQKKGFTTEIRKDINGKERMIKAVKEQ